MGETAHLPRLIDSAAMKTRAAALTIAFALASIPAAAQWKNLSKDGLPLGPDGKVNMSAPAPRTSAGRVDLSGIYQSSYRYFANLAADLGLDKVPMTDEARKIHTARATGLLGYEEPTRTACRKACRRSTWHRCRSASCRPTSLW